MIFSKMFFDRFGAQRWARFDPWGRFSMKNFSAGGMSPIPAATKDWGISPGRSVRRAKKKGLQKIFFRHYVAKVFKTLEKFPSPNLLASRVI